jgi:GNAT superfamily N-acetyltransferase
MVFMSKEAFCIEALNPGDIDRAARFFNYKPGSADDGALRENMASGGWTVVMAATGGADIGGFYLNWRPKYHVYRRLDVPELQDLRVLPGHRRQGAGTALIARGETLARAAGRKGLGLSVGLYADYGNAQRLYADLGYRPDGNGVTYDREAVTPGARLPVDDNLALMLLKFF